jgi:YbbR domain-containing protein
MDLLRVQGRADPKDFTPSEVIGRPVTVEVTSARGRIVTVPGKVVYVDPVVESDGKYVVRAEVKNFEENNQYVLRPGLPAKMIIRLK